MSFFPDTPQTLLRKIAELAQGDDSAVWSDFVERYLPAVRRFVELQSPRLSPENVEDAVQDIFVKLVDLLRRESYDASQARFRTYLAVLMKRVLIDRYRSSQSHDRAIRMLQTSPKTNETMGQSVEDPGVLLDVQWRQAVRQEAQAQLLANSAIAETTRQVYRAYVIDGRPVEEVAAQFHMTPNAVAQVKRRLEAAIQAIETQLCEL